MLSIFILKFSKIIAKYYTKRIICIYFNPLASPSAGAPALKYGNINTVTPSPGEVKGLIFIFFELRIFQNEIFRIEIFRIEIFRNEIFQI